MGNDAMKKEATVALNKARADLKGAYDAMHVARACLEDLDGSSLEGQEFIRHQSDSGALWALANQTGEMRKTINQIIKGLEGK